MLKENRKLSKKWFKWLKNGVDLLATKIDIMDSY